jgi:hypothetical protein
MNVHMGIDWICMPRGCSGRARLDGTDDNGRKRREAIIRLMASSTPAAMCVNLDGIGVHGKCGERFVLYQSDVNRE